MRSGTLLSPSASPLHRGDGSISAHSRTAPLSTELQACPSFVELLAALPFSVWLAGHGHVRKTAIVHVTAASASTAAAPAAGHRSSNNMNNNNNNTSGSGGHKGSTSVKASAAAASEDDYYYFFSYLRPLILEYGSAAVRQRIKKRALNLFFCPRVERRVLSYNARVPRREGDGSHGSVLRMQLVYQQLLRHTTAVLADQSPVQSSLFTALVGALGVKRVDTDHHQKGEEEELSLIDKMLYIILRTSLVANTRSYTARGITPPYIESPVSCEGPAVAAGHEDTSAPLLQQQQQQQAWRASCTRQGSPSALQWAARGPADGVAFSVRPPRAPRLPVPLHCWLAPSVVALVEHNAALRRDLRWSCAPDPVVDALLASPQTLPSSTMLPWGTPTSCRSLFRAPSHAVADGRGRYATAVKAVCNSSWTADTDDRSDAEIAKLFVTRKRRSSSPSTSVPTTEGGSKVEDNGAPTLHALTPVAATSLPPFTVFKKEYTEELCAMVYVALHRCVVGMQDPYLFTCIHLPGGKKESSKRRHGRRQSSSRSRGRTDEAMVDVYMTVSAEFNLARSDGAAPRAPSPKRRKTEEEVSSRPKHRGVIALLQWGCQVGTLFLRLESLCAAAVGQAALGRYGRSAADGLFTCLALLRREVFELASRPGGPHQVRFVDVLRAQRRLQSVATQVEVLASIFHVTGEPTWTCTEALHLLSSATIVSALYQHLAEKHASDALVHHHQAGRRAAAESEETGVEEGGDGAYVPEAVKDQLSTSVDAVRLIFRATLVPLHAMLDAWLTRGQLHDTADEFFIVPAHGTTSSGYTLDLSPFRLPCFISAEAAREMLHAGVSVRVLRAAATHVVLSTTHQERQLEGHLRRMDGDVDNAYAAERDDARWLHLLVKDFVESLVGQRGHEFLRLPTADPTEEQGQLSYWRSYYGACNTVLLSAVQEELQEAMEAAEEERQGSKTGSASSVRAQEGEARALPTVVAVNEESEITVEEVRTDGTSSPSSSVASHITIELASLQSDELDQAVGRAEEERGSRSDVNEEGDDSNSDTKSVLGLLTQLSGNTSLASSTRSSAVTSAMYGAIRQELQQVVQPARLQERQLAKTQREMRAEYEREMMQQRREERLLAWREERLSLQLERVKAINGCVEELRAVYYKEVPEEGEEDEKKEKEETNKEGAIKVVVPLAALPAQVAPPVVLYSTGARHERGATITFAEPTAAVPGGGKVLHERVPSASLLRSVAEESSSSSLRHNSSLKATFSSTGPHAALADSGAPLSPPAPAAASPPIEEQREGVDEHCRRDTEGLPHPDYLYEIAGINDEDYMAGRVGPTTKHIEMAREMEEALAQLAARQCEMAESDINRAAVQAECAAVAQQVLSGGDPSTNVPWDTAAWPFQDPRDAPASLLVGRPPIFPREAVVAPAVLLRLHAPSAAEVVALEQCASHYLQLGRYAASYLTHKALQLTLLPPYGTIYGVLKGLREVCLLQRAPVAGLLTDVWQSVVTRCLHEAAPAAQKEKKKHPTEVQQQQQAMEKEVVKALNHILALEWSKSCKADFGVQWTLLPEEGAGDAPDAPPAKGKNLATRRKDSPLLSLLQLQDRLELQATQAGSMTSKGLWLLPDNFLHVYSVLFINLLFWKTVEQMIAGLWAEGMRSGVAEVFIFAHLARQVLLHHLSLSCWHRLCGVTRTYTAALQFEGGELYQYRCLEDFSEAHERYLNHCLFYSLRLGSAFLATQACIVELACCVEVVAGVVREGNAKRQQLAVLPRGKAALAKAEQTAALQEAHGVLRRHTRDVTVKQMRQFIQSTDALARSLGDVYEAECEAQARQQESGEKQENEFQEERLGFLMQSIRHLNDAVGTLRDQW